MESNTRHDIEESADLRERYADVLAGGASNSQMLVEAAEAFALAGDAEGERRCVEMALQAERASVRHNNALRVSEFTRFAGDLLTRFFLEEIADRTATLERQREAVQVVPKVVTDPEAVIGPILDLAARHPVRQGKYALSVHTAILATLATFLPRLKDSLPRVRAFVEEEQRLAEGKGFDALRFAADAVLAAFEGFSTESHDEADVDIHVGIKYNNKLSNQRNPTRRQGRLTEPPNPPPSPVSAPTGLQTPADALKSLAAHWPEDMEERAAELAAAHHAYRQEYADQLEPIVNARIKHAIDKSTSYDDKKDLIKQLNEELRQGGLAVRCEVTDEAGKTTAVHPGIFVIGTARHEGGRFRVEYQDGGGKKTYGLSSDSPPIKLMPAPSRHDRELGAPEAGTFTGRLTSERSTQASNQV